MIDMAGTEQVAAVLESLKGMGIGAAFIKKDGTLVQATIKVDDVAASVLSSLSNVSATLLKRAKDDQKELELVFDSDLLVVLPVKSYYLCGILKNRDQKKTLREHAAKLSVAV